MIARTALIVGIALAALLVACDGASETDGGTATATETAVTSEPTAAASPSVEATTTPSPQATAPLGLVPGTEPVVELAVQEPSQLPEDFALIVETGCWGCDGGPSGLARVYREPSGRIRSEVLLTAESLGLPPRGETVVDGKKVQEEPYITGLLADDALRMVVSVCTRSFCGGLGFASPDAETALFESGDGGVSWHEVARLDGGYSAVALYGSEVALSDHAEPPPGERSPVLLFPSGETLSPPSADAWFPVSLADGRLLWRTELGFIGEDGAEVLDLSSFPDLGEGWTLRPGWDLRVNPQTGQLAVALYAERLDPSGFMYFLGVFAGDGKLVQVFSLESWLWAGAWTGPTSLIGGFEANLNDYPDVGVEYGLVPATFDLADTAMRPMPSPFYDDSFPARNLRNRVRSVMRGPFARVAAGGGCLHVRAAPSVAAESLDCVADSVLLHDRGERSISGGVTWLAVTTPSGVEGWSSADFLEA